MKKIKRNNYLQRLINVIGTQDIKVVTGMRRAGKSVLLEDFMEFIQANITKSNVIHINFNLLKFHELTNYMNFYNYVKNAYDPKKQNFLIVDEIQMCDKFELAINSLHDEKQFDIYITGSNAFLMSSDLATLFTGRTFELSIYPFSFAEFVDYFEITDKQAGLDRYMFEGGLAGSYDYADMIDKYAYISDIFDTLITRDITTKYGIHHLDTMNNVINFLIENSSCLTSIRKITNYLNSSTSKTNHTTVGNYIAYLCQAFAFYKIKRYDIEGKKYLSTIDKYYLSDHSIRYAKLGTKNLNTGRTLENIVAIELLRRGYEVYVGTYKNTEVDFVASKQSEKIYIQVSDNIADDATFLREVKPLLEIKDAYPKMVIARTRSIPYLYEGVRIIDIADWLLDI